MQVPILNGIYTDENSDFRTSYPVNLVPVPKDTKISAGYLRPADGIVQFGTGPGIDRGGINWNGVCYRVMGTKFVKIDDSGSYTTLGDVGGTDQVTMVYSFDYLAIASNNNLFLWNGLTLQQVTDSDLGVVLDVIWVDGYFMTTDGEFLIVGDLSNPFSINPIKYGSSEADPDPVKGLLTIRNEVYALNRNTIEVFDNIGGEGFPFARVEGAQIERGTLGTHTAVVFMERLIFLGSGRNETPGVWMAQSGQTMKVSTREIDQVLLNYTEKQLSEVVCETKVADGHQHLWIRLPDKTLVYDGAASQVVKEPVWFTLHSGFSTISKYRAQNLVWCYDKWLVGDPTGPKHGYLVNDISSHYGDNVEWEFGTSIIYNKGKGLLFHELELVCLSGRVALDKDPTIYTQYSLDGETWSMPRGIKSGKQGERAKRLVWLQQGNMKHWRSQRFKGTSESHLAVSRLQIEVEVLYV